jgi:hypothetical protein
VNALLAGRLRAFGTFCGALLRILEDRLGLGHGVIARRLFRRPTPRTMGHGLWVGDAIEVLRLVIR